MRIIKVVVTATEKGYWGSIDDSDIAFAFGETLEELVENTKEGIISYSKDCGHEVPEFQLKLVAKSDE